jgi:hypothetical protein
MEYKPIFALFLRFAAFIWKLVLIFHGPYCKRVFPRVRPCKLNGETMSALSGLFRACFLFTVCLLFGFLFNIYILRPQDENIGLYLYSWLPFHDSRHPPFTIQI